MEKRVSTKFLIGFALLAAGALAAGTASAHGRGRVHLGFHFGPYWGPYWGPAWYPAPVYYPPAVVVAPAPAPAQYIERDQPLQSGYWYYCEVSRGYYPYVKECPGGWKAVPPAPPPAQ
jgi:hypothetical protein